MSVPAGISRASTRSIGTLDSVAAAAGDLGSTPDLSIAARTLLESLASATGAARASIMLVNPSTGRLTITAALGLPGHLVGQDVVPRPRSIAEWVYRNGRGIILNGEVRDQRFEASGEDSGAIESALSLPLVAGTQPVGVVNLARTAAPLFGDDAMAEIAAGLAPVASALERVRTAEHATRSWAALADGAAGRCSLMPLGCLEVRGYELGFDRRGSARLCADAVERVPHASGQSVLVLDVSGEGAEAATLAAFVQGTFAALAGHVRSAAEIASRISAAVHARTGGRRTAALWVAHLHRTGELAYCTAGYAPPRWVPADGSPQITLDRGGPIAGAFADATYEEERLRLLPGDLVTVVSDGVLEGRGTTDQPFGAARVAEIVDECRRQPLDHLCAAILDGAIRWSGRPVPIDDAVVFALRYTPGD